jgi:hypothetical protein
VMSQTFSVTPPTVKFVQIPVPATVALQFSPVVDPSKQIPVS